MLFVRNNSNLTNTGFPPIMDLMSSADMMPFADTRTRVRTELFAVPVGAGWTDTAYTLRFVIPGIERNAFELLFQGNRLILRGERRQPDQFRTGEFEFAMQYGRFENVIELPQGLNLKRMDASFHHGLLDVQIPAMDEMKACAVPISTSELAPAVPAVV